MHLKSNMDRFIDNAVMLWEIADKYLKSNMDRFIDKAPSVSSFTVDLFKIQYG